MVDFHTHSTASDGLLRPEGLAALAAERGVSALALTDHDTADGLAAAASACAGLGIDFVPGIELHVERCPGEFHLLGLGLTHISQSLRECIERLHEGRLVRNRMILSKMQEAGMDVSMEELQALYPGTELGRPHIAAYLMEKKIVKKRQEAFNLYLARNRPFYAGRTGINLDEAIVAVCDSGGVPVIAHPLSLYVSWGKLEELLSDFKERGVEGLEAWHPGVRVSEAMRLEALGRKCGYFITAGSDFHGAQIRPDRKLGCTAGGIQIEDRFWNDELRPRLNMSEPFRA